MHWFRSKRIGVTWLALFALAGQLTLSFGHVDLGKVGLALSSGAGKSAASVFRSPPQKSPTDGVGDFCAICASISLARTLLVPTSPALVPPNPFLNKLRWSLAAVEPASFDHLFFNARAPPQA
jgi:hypothetical protein